MTPNESLTISAKLNSIMGKDILQFIYPIFPINAVNNYCSSREKKSRDRVFNEENTLLTMVLTAFKEDKSLQNSVRIFQEIFKKQQKELKKKIKEEEERDNPHKPKRGRPRTKPLSPFPKSKFKDVSTNTAAFSKARKRVDIGLIDTVFKATTDYSDMNCADKWHGRSVYNTDGTYFQMQDTDKIPEKYRSQSYKKERIKGYPQGLLQVLTQHGTGFISNYRIAGRDQSEIDIVASMVDEIPKQSLVIGDDIYSCYSLINLFKSREVDLLIPEKRKRNYNTIKKLAKGDEIVEYIKPTKKCKTFGQVNNIPNKIKMRRISYLDDRNPEIERVIATTILDESIKKEEFIQKYIKRWDVEITIREIKTLMDINISRSKSEDMVFREIGVALIAYNLMRRLIAIGVEKTPFSPKRDIFQELYSVNKDTLVDRKGRVYSKWSPGRP